MMRVLSILLLSLLTAPAWATTYHVNKSGSDANSCATAQSSTPANGKLTITNARLNCLSGGDKLIIHAGTYAEAIDTDGGDIPSGASWATATTFEVASGDTVILQPTSGTNVIAVYCDVHSFIIFDGSTEYGLVIDGVNIGNQGVLISGTTECGYPDHIRLTNYEVKNAAGPGNMFAGSFIESTHCSVHDNSYTFPDQGYYITADHTLVEFCEVFDNECCGIYNFVSGGLNPDDNIIRNNRIYTNGLTSAFPGVGVLVQGDRSQVYNNVIFGNAAGCIIVYASCADCLIYNNTCYNNGSIGIEIQATATNADLINNILRTHTTAISDSGTATTQTTNLTTDPSFTNAGAGDFTLQAGSSARNTGTNVSTVLTTDILGTARPQGAAYDIGAYEFVADEGGSSGRMGGSGGMGRGHGDIRPGGPFDFHHPPEE